MDKQNKKKSEISESELKEIGQKLEEAVKVIDKIRDFSNWMITVGLAILGFFLAVLLQIRFNTIIPDQWLAISALIALSFSVLAGFGIRSHSEIEKWISKVKPGLSAIIDLIGIYMEKGEEKEELQHIRSEFEKFVKDLRNELSSPELVKGVIIQSVSLVIGFLITALYIALYLFTN